MATATATTDITPSAGGLSILAAPFRALGRLMVMIMENNSRVRRVEYLNSLSDAQLAAKGMKREDIVRHVFRDVFYV